MQQHNLAPSLRFGRLAGMLDLPLHPVLDKSTLVGSCLRLPVSVDAERLRAEVAALSPALWGTTAGRVGVHRAAHAVFLRGHAPAAGDLPVEDRPPLDDLPYARYLIEQAFGAKVRSLPGGLVLLG